MTVVNWSVTMASTVTMAKCTYVFVICLFFVSIVSARPNNLWKRTWKGHRSHRTGEVPSAGCQIYNAVSQCQPSLLPENWHYICNIMTRICTDAAPVRQHHCTSGDVKCYLKIMKAQLQGTKNYTESPNGATQFLFDLGQSQNCTRTGTG